MKVLKLVSLAGTAVDPTCSLPGYLSFYDLDAYDGRGEARVCSDPIDALKFDTILEALECWRQPSEIRPWRFDGKPNRPLTAYTVEIEDAG